MSVIVFKSTQKRCNPYAAFTEEDGTKHHKIPPHLYEELPEPPAPEGYDANPNLWYRTEQDEAPYVTYTPKPQEQVNEILIAVYESALDAHLDAVAKQYRYRDRFSFALRSAYPNKWRAQGQKFGEWMDTCNDQAYTLLDAVAAGGPRPTVAEFIASLPVFSPV